VLTTTLSPWLTPDSSGLSAIGGASWTVPWRAPFTAFVHLASQTKLDTPDLCTAHPPDSLHTSANAQLGTNGSRSRTLGSACCVVDRAHRVASIVTHPFARRARLLWAARGLSPRRPCSSVLDTAPRVPVLLAWFARLDCLLLGSLPCCLLARWRASFAYGPGPSLAHLPTLRRPGYRFGR